MNPATATRPRLLRVLLVDDSPDDAFLLLRALGKGGIAAEHARVDSAEAMQDALAGRAWDLVISDYNIPGFGALEALAIARRHDPELPCIVVSGDVDEGLALRARHAGARDCLPKHDLARLVESVSSGVQDAARGSRREIPAGPSGIS